MIPLSYSRIQSFLECPFKFYKKYILKESEPYSTPLAFGSTVHTGIEKVLRGKVDATEEAIEAFMTTSVQKQPYFLNKEHIFEGTQQILAALENALVDDSTLWGGEILSERRFSFNQDWEPCTWRADDIYFRGIIDVYRAVGDTLYLVDWKTSRAVSNNKDQARIYAMIGFLVEDGVTNVQTVFDYIRLGYQDEEIFEPSIKAEMTDWVDSISRQVENTTIWESTPNDFCGYCGFKADCPAFKETVLDIQNEIVTEETIATMSDLDLYKFNTMAKAVAEAADEEIKLRLTKGDIDLGNGKIYTYRKQTRTDVKKEAVTLLLDAGVSAEIIAPYARLSSARAKKILASLPEKDRQDLTDSLLTRRSYNVRTKISKK